MITLNRTKSMCAVNHGLSPFFKSALMSDLQKSGIHTYPFDESLNEVTQTCEMDLHFCYWDANEKLVRSRYGQASFLLNHPKDKTKELPLTNLFQVSMDGPNENLKFFEEFSANFNSNCSHSLIDMETCNFHVFTEALKTGKVASGWGLKKIMKVTYTLLHDSLAQREDYASTVTAIYPLSFCATMYKKYLG